MTPSGHMVVAVLRFINNLGNLCIALYYYYYYSITVTILQPPLSFLPLGSFIFTTTLLLLLFHYYNNPAASNVISSAGSLTFLATTLLQFLLSYSCHASLIPSSLPPLFFLPPLSLSLFSLRSTHIIFFNNFTTLFFLIPFIPITPSSLHPHPSYLLSHSPLFSLTFSHISFNITSLHSSSLSLSYPLYLPLPCIFFHPPLSLSLLLPHILSHFHLIQLHYTVSSLYILFIP